MASHAGGRGARRVRHRISPCRRHPQRDEKHIGGFYFVRVVQLCSEFLFAKRYVFGCNLCFAPLTTSCTQIVPFSVSVLAVVTNKEETLIWPRARTRTKDFSFRGSAKRQSVPCPVPCPVPHPVPYPRKGCGTAMACHPPL